MSEEERQAIIHLLDKQARYEYCIKNNISFSDEDYEAYIIRQSMINKDKEIEKLKLCNSDYYNMINTLSSKLSRIRERASYEETNAESLSYDILKIIDDKNIILGSDK